MNNVSDLGEPDTISDAQRAQEAEEQNKILTDQLKQRALLVAELEMKNQALEKQMLHLEYDTRTKVFEYDTRTTVFELEKRLRQFKKGVRRVMQELARD